MTGVPTALVTGASRGIGAGVARRLAAAGCELILTARDSAAARRTVAEARSVAGPGRRVEWVAADLSDPSDLARLASVALESIGTPDLLLHCAALIPASEQQSARGVEMQWAVNHLAPFQLTRLLEMGSEGARGGRRVVTVASKLHRDGRIDRVPDLFTTGSYDRRQRYCDTKLANVLFARALPAASTPPAASRSRCTRVRRARASTRTSTARAPSTAWSIAPCAG